MKSLLCCALFCRCFWVEFLSVFPLRECEKIVNNFLTFLLPLPSKGQLSFKYCSSEVFNWFKIHVEHKQVDKNCKSLEWIKKKGLYFSLPINLLLYQHSCAHDYWLGIFCWSWNLHWWLKVGVSFARFSPVSFVGEIILCNHYVYNMDPYETYHNQWLEQNYYTYGDCIL